MWITRLADLNEALFWFTAKALTEFCFPMYLDLILATT